MKLFFTLSAVAAFGLLLVACSQALKSSNPGPMSGAIMKALLQEIDEEAQLSANSVVFQIKERELMLVFDESADRMRIMAPVAPAGSVSEDIYLRMLQANHDAVLDPRYSVANDIIWVAFIHKLSTLDKEDFLSAIAQCYTAAETFGSSYTSGALVFGGGDSNAIHEELLEELEKATDPGKDI